MPFPPTTPIVLDGGLATELAKRGFDLSDALWSARLLADAPEAIEAVHRSYFEAGANIAITASYQASFEGFAAYGYSHDDTVRLLHTSVALARAARESVNSADGVPTRDRWVAASVGPYGATLHDGSEYRGDYAVDEDALVDFHRPRIAALLDAGPDLLACETMPCLLEARALLRVLREHPDARAWMTFTCRDGASTSAGDAIIECARVLDAAPHVVAMGINCVDPALVTSLVRTMATATDKPIVVYPNSGEVWNAAAHCWEGTATRFTAYLDEWMDAGASWIGGCCRTTPEDIRVVRAVVDAAHGTSHPWASAT
ncbi:MAG: homocysteine S-methyltransferase [Gemmatimonadaceae bacterium]|jgi:homocysteine S-methyltransferase|nr:homocysteine S-methyltransferase [Gemmatimonadaceae bacterium]